MAGSMIEEIISFAIDKEKEAIAFYEDLARKVKNPVIKEAILALADEERKHEKLLKGLTPKKIALVRNVSRPGMKISDYLVETPITADMTYQELIIVAMKREEKAFALYNDLETRALDEATRKVFSLLKGEELRHKSRLEQEYQEHVLWEG